MTEGLHDGVVECRIQGTRVTAELVAAYVRSWARHGVYFDAWHRGSSLLGDVPAARTRSVSHDVFTYRFSHGHPDPGKRGKANDRFLDPGMLQSAFFTTLTAERSPEGILVFPISHIYRTEGLTLERFLDKLATFLAALPPGSRYAVGVQNREYLLPEYFSCLQEHGVSHTFTSGETMPPLPEQVRSPYALTSGAAVVVTEPGPGADWQLGMMEIVRRCLDAKKELHVRLQAVHPGVLMPSLAMLMEAMSGDLAKRSPFRKKAA
jgi:hypothetical protein